jgi:hypothetical protein
MNNLKDFHQGVRVTVFNATFNNISKGCLGDLINSMDTRTGTKKYGFVPSKREIA